MGLAYADYMDVIGRTIEIFQYLHVIQTGISRISGTAYRRYLFAVARNAHACYSRFSLLHERKIVSKLYRDFPCY